MPRRRMKWWSMGALAGKRTYDFWKRDRLAKHPPLLAAEKGERHHYTCVNPQCGRRWATTEAIVWRCPFCRVRLPPPPQAARPLPLPVVEVEEPFEMSPQGVGETSGNTDSKGDDMRTDVTAAEHPASTPTPPANPAGNGEVGRGTKVMLTSTQAANMLDVSPAVVYRLVSEGVFPGAQITHTNTAAGRRGGKYNLRKLPLDEVLALQAKIAANLFNPYKPRKLREPRVGSEAQRQARLANVAKAREALARKRAGVDGEVAMRLKDLHDQVMAMRGDLDRLITAIQTVR